MAHRQERSLADERGAVGRIMLLALAGLVIGAPIGFLGGAALALVVCRGGGGGAYGEGCGMAWVVFTFLGVPIGAVIGAIVGAVLGIRRDRRAPTREGGGVDAIEREAPLAAWLAVAGGAAVAFGAFTGWRTVLVPYAEIERLKGVLASGPEPLAFLGGVLAFFGGVLRVLRPAAPAPSGLIGVGAFLAIVGVVWGLADFLQVPSDLTKELFFGMWISCVGSVLAAAGLFADRPAKDLWHRWRRVATA